MEDGILVAILLVDKADGDSCGLEAKGRRGLGGNGGLVPPQLDVLLSQRDGATGARWCGALSNSKQEEESQSDEVSHGLKSRIGGVSCCHQGDPLDCGHRECQFWLGRWVHVSPAAEGCLEARIKMLTVAVHSPGIQNPRLTMTCAQSRSVFSTTLLEACLPLWN